MLALRASWFCQLADLPQIPEPQIPEPQLTDFSTVKNYLDTKKYLPLGTVQKINKFVNDTDVDIF